MHGFTRDFSSVSRQQLVEELSQVLICHSLDCLFSTQPGKICVTRLRLQRHLSSYKLGFVDERRHPSVLPVATRALADHENLPGGITLCAVPQRFLSLISNVVCLLVQRQPWEAPGLTFWPTWRMRGSLRKDRAREGVSVAINGHLPVSWGTAYCISAHRMPRGIMIAIYTVPMFPQRKHFS